MKTVAIAVLGALAANAMAAPSVSYSVSGTSGNYILDFSVTNNLAGTDQDIYFFGVQLGNRDIVGSPTGFDPEVWMAWENLADGGSATVYNNNWFDVDHTHLGVGTTLSGFQVHTSDLTVPASVPYFIFGVSPSSADYNGGGTFNGVTLNPGFEGVATQAVPEPLTIAALGLGFAGVLRRRR